MNNDSLTDIQKIELSYFFSKLYVAVTRAKERLWIVDTPDGINRLWNLLTIIPQNVDIVQVQTLVEGTRGAVYRRYENYF